MIKSNNGEVMIAGEAVQVLSELEQLIMRVKRLISKEESVRMVFDMDMLAMFLAKDDEEFIKINGEADKDKLMKKIEKVYKYMEEKNK